MEKRGHVTSRNREMMNKRAPKNFAKMQAKMIEGIQVAYALPEECICSQYDESDGRMHFVYQGKFSV